jgi:hypothetical protein
MVGEWLFRGARKTAAKTLQSLQVSKVNKQSKLNKLTLLVNYCALLFRCSPLMGKALAVFA